MPLKDLPLWSVNFLHTLAVGARNDDVVAAWRSLGSDVNFPQC